MARLPLSLIVLALVAGCADDEAPLPTEGTLLEYTRSGGIAFSLVEVRIDAGGTGVVASGGNPEDMKERRFELTAAQLDELRQTLAENPIDSLPDPGDQVCADCFVYSLAYGGEEYEFDQVADVPEGASAVTALLADLPIPDDTPNGG